MGPKIALRTLALAVAAFTASTSPVRAQTAEMSRAVCEARETESRIQRGLPAVVSGWDSVMLASLDSAIVRFREGRRPPRPHPDSVQLADRDARLLNPGDLQRRMQTLYPPELIRARVGGITLLVAAVRPDSTVFAARVLQSSGAFELDLASVRVIEGARVAPVIFRGCAAWTVVRLPVRWVP